MPTVNPLLDRGGRTIEHFLNEGGFPGLSAIGDPPLPVAQIRQDLFLGQQIRQDLLLGQQIRQDLLVGCQAAAKPPGGGDSCALDEE